MTAAHQEGERSTVDRDRLTTDDLLGERPPPESQQDAGAGAARQRASGDDVSEPNAPSSASASGAVAAEGQDAPLLSPAEGRSYRQRWDAAQAGFVDEPRTAVAAADELVAELMRHLAEVFSRQRQELEATLGRGDEVSTEDLRLSLKRYRSFFNRLLSH